MSDNRVVREILTEIDRDPSISQKRLSIAIGISVGMINWHIKKCVNKGLIKLQQVPVRRYLYYLTPEGFSEKAKLSASYLQHAFDMFQSGREQYGALLSLCQANGWNEIVIIGDTELAELVLLLLPRFQDLKIVAILDNQSERQMHGPIPVYSTVKEIKQVLGGHKLSAVIACSFSINVSEEFNIDKFMEQAELDYSRLLIPGILQ